MAEESTVAGDKSVVPDQQVASGVPRGVQPIEPKGSGNPSASLIASLRAQSAPPPNPALLGLMMGSPMSAGQQYASAVAGGVAQMHGRANPVQQQYEQQQESQREAAKFAYQQQEKTYEQARRRNEATFKIVENGMESPDRATRELYARDYFPLMKELYGIDYSPAQQRTFITRGGKGDWLKDFYGDALATNAEGQPVFSLPALAKKYDLDPDEAKDWYARRTDAATLKQHGGYKTPQEMADDLIKSRNIRNDSFLTAHPELRGQAELFRRANTLYRKMYGMDLLGTVESGEESDTVRKQIDEVVQLAKDDIDRAAVIKRQDESRAGAIGTAPGQRIAEQEGYKHTPGQAAEESAVGRARGEKKAEDAGFKPTPEEASRARARGSAEGHAEGTGGAPGKGNKPSTATEKAIDTRATHAINQAMSPDKKPNNSQWGTYDSGSTYDAGIVRDYYYKLEAYKQKLQDPLYKANGYRDASGKALVPPTKPDQVVAYENSLTDRMKTKGIFGTGGVDKRVEQQSKALQSLTDQVASAEQARGAGEQSATPGADGPRLPGQGQPPQQQRPAGPGPLTPKVVPPPGKVVVRSREGELVTIPRENLKKALEQGAVLVQ